MYLKLLNLLCQAQLFYFEIINLMQLGLVDHGISEISCQAKVLQCFACIFHLFIDFSVNFVRFLAELYVINFVGNKHGRVGVCNGCPKVACFDEGLCNPQIRKSHLKRLINNSCYGFTLVVIFDGSIRIPHRIKYVGYALVFDNKPVFVVYCAVVGQSKAMIIKRRIILALAK